MTRKLLNAKEATEILGISGSFLYKLVRQGEVQAIRFGKSVRFLPGNDRGVHPEEQSQHNQWPPRDLATMRRYLQIPITSAPRNEQ